MNRTTLLTAVTAIAVVFAAATPAFAMRDPGPGGMYGLTPPRVGQSGVGGQYSDGMNLYHYTRSNPVGHVDPHGLKTTRWYPSVRLTDGPFGWTASFDAAFNHGECKLEFRPKVQLDAVDSGVEAKVKQLVPQWEQAIAGAYNKWKLVPEHPDQCCECKSGIQLDFRVKFVVGWTWTDDHEVKVDSTAARSDMKNWHLGDNRLVNAPFLGVIHEIGHMYGLIDEYVDARSPGRVIPPDANTGVMSCRTASVLQRNVERVVNDIAKANDHLPCKVKVAPR